MIRFFNTTKIIKLNRAIISKYIIYKNFYSVYLKKYIWLYILISLDLKWKVCSLIFSFNFFPEIFPRKRKFTKLFMKLEVKLKAYYVFRSFSWDKSSFLIVTLEFGFNLKFRVNFHEGLNYIYNSMFYNLRGKIHNI